VTARLLLILAGVFALASASGSSSASAGAGLFGTVRLVPGSPTCQIGTSCSRPARGFKLVFTRNGRKIATATTDKRGRYRVSLARGRYSVKAANRGVSPKAGLTPRTASVPAGRFAKRDFTFDSGIR
jgi:hypothetical protein